MKKVFKHNGQSCTVEITSTKTGHTITGSVSGKVETTRNLPLEDDVSHHAEGVEEELKAIIDRPKKKASPHIKRLKDKGYK